MKLEIKEDRYKNRLWKGICFGILCIVIVVTIRSKIQVYEWDYLGKLGIPVWTDYRLERDIRKHFGDPIATWKEGEYQRLQYDKFIFCKSIFLGYVKVSDPSVKFGKCKIGLGSDRGEVEKAYLGITRVDENNKVQEIIIYDGP